MERITLLDEYQEKSKRTMNLEESEEKQLSNYAMGLAGEAGEVVDLIKKHLHHGHPLNIAKVDEELGDVMFYINAICTLLGLSYEGVANHNYKKLLERFPDEHGFDKERSLNRKEYR